MSNAEIGIGLVFVLLGALVAIWDRVCIREDGRLRWEDGRRWQRGERARYEEANDDTDQRWEREGRGGEV